MNIEHQSKSKLAWPVCTEYEIKIKKVQEPWLQIKWSFYWFMLFSGGLTIGGDEGRGEWVNI